MIKNFTLISCAFLFFAFHQNIQSQDYLKKCYNKQVKALNGKCLCVSYRESSNELNHDFEPWKQTNTKTTGTAWSRHEDFSKSDTLNSGGKLYTSKSQYDKSALLFQDYGDTGLYHVTIDMFNGYMLETARYSPVNIINFALHYSPPLKSEMVNENGKDYAVYKLEINRAVVRLFIRTEDNLLEKIVTMKNDDMLGDIVNTYYYRGYSEINGFPYPALIEIDKVNGRLHDEIDITSSSLISQPPVLLVKPADYVLYLEAFMPSSAVTEKYNDNLYFINLPNSESQTAVVVFSDFVLVAEAPLSSENGELIIAEVWKIAPGKPIRYFAFGHHHPWSLGGMRPFVHNGTTILSVKEDLLYLQYLATAPHTMHPDSQQIQPKKLMTEEIDANKTITDGNYKMEIYHIGEKSAHTKDFLVFYFPAEKLLFEGDLVWISKTGEIKKAGKRQAGLYNAVKELGLDVETVIQHWPTGEKYGVKSVIPFNELEQSVNVK